MILNDYLQFIQETKSPLKGNVSYDIDKFLSGKSKKLLIMGLPGTGKTTLGHKLEQKLKISVYHTDDCIKETFKSVSKNINPSLFLKKCYKDCIEPNLKSSRPLIIEGIIYQWYDLIPSSRKLIIQFPSIVTKEVFKKRFGNRKIDIKGKSLSNMLSRYIKDKEKVSTSIKPLS